MNSGVEGHTLILTLLAALTLAGCGGAEAEPITTPTFTQQEQAGSRSFERLCASCHSTLPEVVIVGPSLAGIGQRAASRVRGQDARTYLTQSVSDPSAYLVEGYRDLMPKNLKSELSQEQMENVVAYLLTLE